MKARVILNILSTCLLLGMVSCAHDILEINPSDSTMEFTITTRNSGDIESRATEAGDDLLNENKIDKLDLFFCKSDGTIYWYVEDSYIKIENGGDSYTKRVGINIPQTRMGDLEGASYNLYAVVNGPSRSELESAGTVSALQSLTLITPAFDRQSQPANFLMTGVVNTGTISLAGTYTIATQLELERAASKIRIILKAPVNVPDKFEFDLVGVPRVRIVNYIDETSLLPGAPVSSESEFQGYKNTQYESMGLVSTSSGVFYTTTLPFYTYENDWRDKSITETRLLIEAVFKSTKNGANTEPVTYYYNISINNLMEANSEKAERNTLYEVTADIAKLGSTEESLPVHIESSVAVLPWPVRSEMDGEIIKAVYLVVKEKDVIMPNISTREIEYISNLPVTIENITTSYTTYDPTTGAPVTVNPPTQPSITTVTRANDKTFLVINSPIPINFVPLNIEFDVTNGEMTEHVNITQYPPRYVTAFQGARKVDYYQGDENGPADSGAGAHYNFSLFRITTLVNNADVTIDGVVCLIGDAQNRETNTRTGTDLNTNRLISPDFIIASQNGVTVQIYLDKSRQMNHGSGMWPDYRMHEGAESRCYNYYEQTYGPGRLHGGRWRVPTRAEIAYIDALQDNTNSAVKKLLEGDAYWSAQRYYYYNFNVPGGSWTGNSSSVNNVAHVRCVYDMYKITTP